MSFTTRSKLLNELASNSPRGWEEFTRYYSPLLKRFANRYGLKSADVDDIVQGVLVELYHAREHFVYDRTKGRFRGYLKKAVMSRIQKAIREIDRAGIPQGSFADQPENELESEWDREYEAHLLQEALRQVRMEVEPRTFQAFDLYVMQEQPPREVAHFLGISVSAVYTYKTRVLEKLTAIVERLQEE